MNDERWCYMPRRIRYGVPRARMGWRALPCVHARDPGDCTRVYRSEGRACECVPSLFDTPRASRLPREWHPPADLRWDGCVNGATLSLVVTKYRSKKRTSRDQKKIIGGNAHTIKKASNRAIQKLYLFFSISANERAVPLDAWWGWGWRGARGPLPRSLVQGVPL